ncbi:hypothetical protein D3C86_1708840 [compost metagenome]
MRVADQGRGQHRQPIHRDQVHEVHQEDPDEDGQTQRCDQGVAAVEGVFDPAIDEFDQHFDEVLQTTRLPGCGALGGGAEQQNEDQAEHHRHRQGIDMECPEAHFLGFPGVVGKAPAVDRVLTVGQVGQVMLDITRSGFCCCHISLER